VVAYRVGGLAGVGLVGLMRAVPAALVGPFAVAAVDRYPRARVLLVVLALRAVLASIAAGIVASSLPDALVFGLAAIDALVYSVWWPTHSALLPELARTPDEATAANVATTVVENLGTSVGPLAGGAMLAVAGPEHVFALAAVLLDVGALCLVGVPSSGRAGLTGDAGRWLAGFRAAFGVREPRAVIVLYLAQTACLGALGVLLVAIAIERLDLGESGVGLLTAALGAGGVAGATAAAALIGRRVLGLALAGALVGWALGAAVSGTAPWAAVVVVALGGVGVANAVVDVAGLTLLQRVVDASDLTRVLGVFEGAWWAMLGLGSVVAAPLGAALGAGGALVAIGSALVLVTVAFGGVVRSLDRAGAPAPADDIVELLRGVPFLARLPPLALERLALDARVTDVHAGDEVIAVGEVGDRFFVVAHGALDVVGHRSLGAGSWFGEVALLRDVRRTATVVARTDARLVAVTRGAFLRALALDPASHELALTHAAQLVPA